MCDRVLPFARPHLVPKCLLWTMPAMMMWAEQWIQCMGPRRIQNSECMPSGSVECFQSEHSHCQFVCCHCNWNIFANWNCCTRLWIVSLHPNTPLDPNGTVARTVTFSTLHENTSLILTKCEEKSEFQWKIMKKYHWKSIFLLKISLPLNLNRKN